MFKHSLFYNLQALTFCKTKYQIPVLYKINNLHDLPLITFYITQKTIITKKEYLRIINNLNISGADGIILGCTEIPLLVKNSDSKLPLFDTAAIHADEALNL